MNQIKKDREKLLILGVDSSTRDVLAYAASRSVYTIITDYLPVEKQPVKALADENWTLNITDLDQLEQRCKEEQVTAVFAGNHELCLDMTRQLAGRLGFPFYASDKGWAAARNKTIFKSYCAGCGLDTPKRYPLTEAFDTELLEKIDYPVITKPSDASSQKGFHICRTEEELREGYEDALGYSDNRDIIVEDYIEGPEFDIICYVHEGQLQILCMNDRLGAMVNGRMNQTFTPNQSLWLEDFTRKHLGQLQSMAGAIEYREGALFFQAIYRDGRYYFLEMGLRLDGISCWSTVSSYVGFNYLNCMVDIALGRKPEADFSGRITDRDQMHSAIYLYWANPGKIDRIEGLEKIKAMEGVTVSMERFVPGDTVKRTDNMLQIAYFIGIVGSSSKDLADKLRFINENLYLVNEQGENMMVCYDKYANIAENY